jgi:hypothetical protein
MDQVALNMVIFMYCLLEDHGLDYIYILYTIYKCLVALQSTKFKFFQVTSLLSLCGQRVLAGQSPAWLDKARLARTMSGQLGQCSAGHVSGGI